MATLEKFWLASKATISFIINGIIINKMRKKDFSIKTCDKILVFGDQERETKDIK